MMTMRLNNYKAKSKKSVSFNPRAAVYPVLHIADYSDVEVAACWYNESEEGSIHRDMEKTMTLIQVSGSKMINRGIREVLCTRGIKTEQDRRRCFADRQAAWDAALSEQEFQFSQNVTDPELLAMACSKETRQARFRALQMGHSDRQACVDRKVSSSKKTNAASHSSVCIIPHSRREFSSRAA